MARWHARRSLLVRIYDPTRHPLDCAHAGHRALRLRSHLRVHLHLDVPRARLSAVRSECDGWEQFYAERVRGGVPLDLDSAVREVRSRWCHGLACGVKCFDDATAVSTRVFARSFVCERNGVWLTGFWFLGTVLGSSSIIMENGSGRIRALLCSHSLVSTRRVGHFLASDCECRVNLYPVPLRSS